MSDNRRFWWYRKIQCQIGIESWVKVYGPKKLNWTTVLFSSKDRLISSVSHTDCDHPLPAKVFGSLGPFTLDLTQKIIKVYAIPDYDFVAAVQNVDKDIASGKLKSAPKFDDTRRLQDLTTGK